MKYNKTVIITGASKGIGFAMAELFAKNNYNVLINYNRSEKSAVELCEKLNTDGFSTTTYRADISHRKQIEAMLQYCINEFGSIDILINNAGISQEKLFTEITDTDLNTMIDVNLKGTFYCCQEVLKYMIPNETVSQIV
jgi:3-oxoacyl-[acyl-carrier protein] reductase